MKELILYNYFRSSTSYRVRIALEIKNLRYIYKPIHLLNNGGEQNSKSFRELNPSGGVPTLVHGDAVISQSFVIIEYLDDAFPDSYQLMPVDPLQKAKVRQVCEIINADMHALQNLKVLQYLEKKHNYTQDDKDKWCQQWIRPSFHALEKILSKTSDEFCFAETLTAADVLLIPQVITAERFKTDLAEFPTIQKIYKTCIQRPEFMKAHPFRQIDTPEELRLKPGS